MEAKKIAQSIVGGHGWCATEIEPLAQAYLSLLKQHEGHVLVPLEPTDEMLEAVLTASYNEVMALDGWAVKFVYKAMIKE